MASLREWTALSLSALLFSVVAGYGVGKALNAKNEVQAPTRIIAPTIAIIDRTGEPTEGAGGLSDFEMKLPSLVASGPATEAAVPEPESIPSAPIIASPPLKTSAIPDVIPVSVPAAPAMQTSISTASVPTPVRATERASILISFPDQRLYLMVGDRQIASYRVKLAFDPVRVKPGLTQVQAKNAQAKTIELGWKGFPVVAGGDRGFILTEADFEAVLARVGVGTSVMTTRERVAGAATPPNARLIQPPQPIEPVKLEEPPAQDSAQPAFLAAVPRSL
jgi:hypothetical protein